jgi:hypothetical protein
MYGDTYGVMRPVNAPYVYGDMYAGSRDVSAPWGCGRGRSPGRRPGSLTSRLQHRPEFPAGTERRPAVGDAADARVQKVLLYSGLAPPTHLSMTRPLHLVISGSAGTERWTNPPWVVVPFVVRGRAPLRRANQRKELSIAMR